MNREKLENLTLREIKKLIYQGDKEIINEILEYLLPNKTQSFLVRRMIRMTFGIDLTQKNFKRR